jgi:hypothetical protein
MTAQPLPTPNEDADLHGPILDRYREEVRRYLAS